MPIRAALQNQGVLTKLIAQLFDMKQVAPAQSRCHCSSSGWPARASVEGDLHFEADKTISAYAIEARDRGHIVT
jgi:hypothetical protein